MLGSARRKAAAALRAVSKGSGFGSRAAHPRGALLLPGRPGEHAPSYALALAVVPSQVLPWLSLLGGGGARPAAPRAGTDALASIAMGRGFCSGGGGVSRQLTGIEQQQLTKSFRLCTDGKGLLELVEQHGESFNVLHISAAWAALATLRGGGGTGDEGVVLQRIQVMTRATLQEMGARVVGNVVHAMSKLQANLRQGVDAELVGELQARAAAVAGDFEPKHVSNFLWSLSRMGVKQPDAHLLEAMQNRAKQAAGQP
ncbi:hypothetical protein T484DRAFT_1847477 [Baffinella frigidus]|nr:hypothetical protein T484DRAFT_1847477 [Cryptophyta sp. CCMP2293]